MQESVERAGNPTRGRERLVRTCVGCWQREAAAELLRVVAVTAGPDVRLVPDPRRRLPGRGAHVHRNRDCVEAALRRRTFTRALRLRNAPDPTGLWEYITQQVG